MKSQGRGWFRAKADGIGCGFLGAREFGRWLEGSLAPMRREAFDVHRNGGCAACALVAADADAFRFVVERGPVASERREWRAVSAIHAAELRQMLERGAARRATTASAWSWPRLAGLAAAAVLAIAVVAPFVFQRSTPGTFELGGSTYTARALPFSAPVEIRAEGDGLAALWREAGDAYDAGRWDEAADRFAALADSDPASRDAALYGGIALVMAGRYDEAVEPLDAAVRLGDAIGASPATPEYYLGLAALGRGDSAAARTAFQAAAAAGGSFGTEAESVLERLPD